jgi:hypothetical protein
MGKCQGSPGYPPILAARPAAGSALSTALPHLTAPGQLQAFFLVADDIMDGSITRRGQPCWYKMVVTRPSPRTGGAPAKPTCPLASSPCAWQENVGHIAINDSFLIESAIYKLLKRHFRTQTYYVDLLELLHEASKKRAPGGLGSFAPPPHSRRVPLADNLPDRAGPAAGPHHGPGGSSRAGSVYLGKVGAPRIVGILPPFFTAPLP